MKYTSSSFRLTFEQCQAIRAAREAHWDTTGVRPSKSQAILAGLGMWVRAQGVHWPADDDKENT